MSLDPAGWLLPLVQCLHAFSFGATHLGSVLFAAEAAGSRDSATAQADFGTVLAFGAVIATACSGFLYGALGDGAYLAMAAITLVGSLLLVVGSRLRH
jgi:PPP family 3-phenylpropionic acid transporter